MYCSIVVFRKYRFVLKFFIGFFFKKFDKFEANLDRGLEILKSRVGFLVDS